MFVWSGLFIDSWAKNWTRFVKKFWIDETRASIKSDLFSAKKSSVVAETEEDKKSDGRGNSEDGDDGLELRQHKTNDLKLKCGQIYRKNILNFLTPKVLFRSVGVYRLMRVSNFLY